MIKPTVGRVVWYRHDLSPGVQPLAAIIAYVHSDRMVNLMVMSPDGVTFPLSGVALHQDGDPYPTEPGFCEWMHDADANAAPTFGAAWTRAKGRGGGMAVASGGGSDASWDALRSATPTSGGSAGHPGSSGGGGGTGTNRP